VSPVTLGTMIRLAGRFDDAVKLTRYALSWA
jgi:hypothetical protein